MKRSFWAVLAVCATGWLASPSIAFEQDVRVRAASHAPAVTINSTVPSGRASQTIVYGQAPIVQQPYVQGYVPMQRVQTYYPAPQRNYVPRSNARFSSPNFGGRTRDWSRVESNVESVLSSIFDF